METKTKMKSKSRQRPWLSPSGVALPTEQIKQFCKSWDRMTWESYLKWFESRRRESLNLNNEYDQYRDSQTQTVFETCGPETNGDLQSQCAELLSTLPPVQAQVLEQTFIEGKTQSAIATIINRSRGHVAYLKDKAITNLKQGHSGDGSSTRRIVKDEEIQTTGEPTLLWDQKLLIPIKEHRAMRAETLSLRQLKILNSRFFNDLQHQQIAQDLNLGINVIQEMEDTAVLKVKREIIETETGRNSGEEDSCA